MLVIWWPWLVGSGQDGVWQQLSAGSVTILQAGGRVVMSKVAHLMCEQDARNISMSKCYNENCSKKWAEIDSICWALFAELYGHVLSEWTRLLPVRPNKLSSYQTRPPPPNPLPPPSSLPQLGWDLVWAAIFLLKIILIKITKWVFSPSDQTPPHTHTHHHPHPFWLGWDFVQAAVFLPTCEYRSRCTSCPLATLVWPQWIGCCANAGERMLASYLSVHR